MFHCFTKSNSKTDFYKLGKKREYWWVSYNFSLQLKKHAQVSRSALMQTHHFLQLRVCKSHRIRHWTQLTRAFTVKGSVHLFVPLRDETAENNSIFSSVIQYWFLTLIFWHCHQVVQVLKCLPAHLFANLCLQMYMLHILDFMHSHKKLIIKVSQSIKSCCFF